MPLYEYACSAGHVSESRQGLGVATIPCPCCDLPAQRQSVYRFAIGGERPTRYRLSEFQEAASEANYYHGKMENDRGRELPRVPVVNMAANEARKRGAKVGKVPRGI